MRDLLLWLETVIGWDLEFVCCFGIMFREVIRIPVNENSACPEFHALGMSQRDGHEIKIPALW